MGLAVGNEVELIKDSDAFPDCNKMLWTDEYYWKATMQRIAEMDALGPVWQRMPVTAVFTAAAFAFPGSTEYQKKAFKKYGDRWAYTFNLYSYWAKMSGSCSSAIHTLTCWDPKSQWCLQTKFHNIFRQRVTGMTGSKTTKMWI